MLYQNKLKQDYINNQKGEIDLSSIFFLVSTYTVGGYALIKSVDWGLGKLADLVDYLAPQKQKYKIKE